MSDQKKLTGGCLCKQIRYTCDAEPIGTYVCCCHRCQRWSGSVFFVGVSVPADSVKSEGKLAKHSEAGGTTGRRVNRHFCPACGSSVLLEIETTDRIYIMAGTLDDSSNLKPIRAIFCDEKQPWLPLPEGLPQLAGPPG
jgi:hypothetical protein